MIPFFKSMKKLRNIVCIIFSVTSIVQLNAQFNFSTGNEVSFEITQTYETIEVRCVPNPISDMLITWDLIEVDPSIPSVWDFTICDQICYPFFPNHGTPINYTASQFLSGEDYHLKLGVSVNGVEGSGYVKYYIYDGINPSYGDTVIYHLNYQISGLEEKNEHSNNIIWSLSEGKMILFSKTDQETHFTLYQSDGTLICRSKFLGQTTIDRALLPGIYFLNIDEKTTYTIYV